MDPLRSVLEGYGSPDDKERLLDNTPDTQVRPAIPTPHRVRRA